jgi:hypothetical protein
MIIGPKGENLVFLISQQRAGSTLLQRILAGHPAIHTTAEPWLMLHPVYALRGEGHTADYNAILAHKALEDFLSTLDEGHSRYLEAIRRMAVQLYGTACEQAGKPLFLDKTPRYYYIIPELAQIFPEARFIMLLRNPLAVLASILNTWVKGHWALLPRYRDDLLVAPQRLAEGIELLGERASIVRYEDLVTEPASTVEALCARLNLDFRPDMLDYGKTEPAGQMGDPTGVDRHTRPTSRNLDRWLELGKDRQTRHLIEGYVQTLGPELLAALGYDHAELKAKLMPVPCKQGKISFRWRQVVEPDPTFQKRAYLVELALLEHRRLVHTFRGWAGKFRRGEP